MLFRNHIISISSRDKPWHLKRSLYENASMLSSQKLVQLLENISEGLDHGESIDLDTIFTVALERAHTDNDAKMRLLDLALKASNFVQRLLWNFLKIKFQEKHRLRISQNLYFNTKIGAAAVERIIAFARENINSKNWDIKLRSHCLLELFGVKGKRDNNVLLFVSYVCSRNDESRNEILLEWSREVGKACSTECAEVAEPVLNSVPLQDVGEQNICNAANSVCHAAANTGTVHKFRDVCMDLEPFFIPKMLLSEFFIKEMQYMRNYSVVEKVLENLRSHKIVYGLFTMVFIQEKRKRWDLGSIIARTFRAEDVEYTKAVFEKVFIADEVIAEKALKKFIVETRCTALSELFYMRCNKIDSRFIESCIICRDSIALLGKKVCSVVKSHYLPFLAKEHDMFEKVVLILERVSFPIESAVPYFFRNQDVMDEKNLTKLLFFLQRYKSTKQVIRSIFCSALVEMQRCLDSEPCTRGDGEAKAGLLGDSAVPVFFQLVSAMRGFSVLEEFGGLFVHIDCGAFLDILLPCDGNLVVDTFLVRSLNEIYKCRKWLRGVYELAQARLVSSRLLHLDDYWSTAARKQVKMDVSNHACNDEDMFHDNALGEDFCKLIMPTRLVAHVMACKAPVPCSVAQRILDGREKYKEGLALNESLIRIKVGTRRVCAYGIFHQYGNYGSSMLFSLISSQGEVLSLGILGGIYFIQSSEGTRNGKLLLLGSAEADHQRKVAIEVCGSSVALHSCLGKSTFKIRDVAEVIVGENFKGVVSRLVLHDCFGYISNLLDEMDRCEYFLQRLRNLEKKLAYADGFGIYLDSCYPYQLTRKPMEISFSNVMCVRNLEWRENDFVKERMFRGSKFTISVVDTDTYGS